MINANVDIEMQRIVVRRAWTYCYYLLNSVGVHIGSPLQSPVKLMLQLLH